MRIQNSGAFKTLFIMSPGRFNYIFDFIEVVNLSLDEINQAK